MMIGTPFADAQHRIGVAVHTEVWAALDDAAASAIEDRALELGSFAALPEADKVVIREALLEASARGTGVLDQPSWWGDWAAIDAAVESGDVAELDAALGTVGVRPEVLVGLRAAELLPDGVEYEDPDAAEDPDDETFHDTDVPTVDTDGWVGV